MTPAQQTIAAVLREHGFRVGGNLGNGEFQPHTCWGSGCTWEGTYQQHADHVAAEVDAALGTLTRKPAVSLLMEPSGQPVILDDETDIRSTRRCYPDRTTEGGRWVSGWTPQDGNQ